ncbi:malonyl-ACP O-methyltransferase BioC [Providencia vermicola]|uniref:Malonyl-[acyl-carrier protein] O-methyltransferase n=1 Tax=Providencia vermicola TaxID=333965 RepID=A0AAX3RT57_9GAMM|nr:MULTISPECIES: malonyl-ACP O-methyltransferase BioC [Providencia]ELX8380258.1 malonyl-ACP O-methyltransferase BioC [Providencia stuartii]EMD5259795.1 malonyl-ACP O-methyltransferase BioC [Providencia stuartii]MBG5920893.1 malonyl-ACP O-methyltransferase BioC [Providencia stuartii]QIC16869.1 malonyl-ACP O-methyltransferase BioC [Providencia vermicola]USB36897.1 malonyl-ACP O-methyltransferase BioC [Providencia vermicola]
MVLPLSDEKQKIASAFGKAAKRYDSIAYYQQNSGHQLLDLLASAQVNLSDKKVIDVGCGTGFFSQIIKRQGAEVTALDLSLGMLEVARDKKAAAQYICADMELLPFADQTFDIVFSNLAIQWCSNLSQALTELHRVTKSGGVIVFTTLAKGSLSELSQAWAKLDGYSHVNEFLSFELITASCQPWKHQLLLQPDKLYFPDLARLLNSLKGIGATHLTAGRQGGLMTRQRLQQLTHAYPASVNGLELTYQTVFGIIYRD